MRKLTDEEYRRWLQFHKRGGSCIKRCPVNQPMWDVQPEDVDHKRHEMRKLELGYDLIAQGHRVIFEAVENRSVYRRDVVDLTTGVVYEIVSKNKDKKLIELYKSQRVKVVYA